MPGGGPGDKKPAYGLDGQVWSQAAAMLDFEIKIFRSLCKDPFNSFKIIHIVHFFSGHKEKIGWPALSSNLLYSQDHFKGVE